MINGPALTKNMLPRETSRYFYVEESDGGLQLQAKEQYGRFFVIIDIAKTNRYTVLFSSAQETRTFSRDKWMSIRDYIQSFWRDRVFTNNAARPLKGA